MDFVVLEQIATKQQFHSQPVCSLNRSLLLEWTRGNSEAIALIRSLFPGRGPFDEALLRKALIRTVIGKASPHDQRSDADFGHALERSINYNRQLARQMFEWRQDSSAATLAALTHCALRPQTPAPMAHDMLGTLGALDFSRGLQLLYALSFLYKCPEQKLALNCLEIISARHFFRRAYELLLEGVLEADYHRELACSVNDYAKGGRYPNVPSWPTIAEIKVSPDRISEVADLSGTAGFVTEHMRTEAISLADILKCSSMQQAMPGLRILRQRDSVLCSIVSAARRARFDF